MQGSFGAVFVIEHTRRKVGNSARKGEKVVVKKLLGSSLDFINVFAKGNQREYSDNVTHAVISFN